MAAKVDPKTDPKYSNVLLLVDSGPRWFRENTIVGPTHGDPDERARCVVWERQAVVAFDLDGSVELIAVESSPVRRYLNVEALRGQYIAIGGYYGGEYVAEVERCLRDGCGLKVVVVCDLCLWENVDEAQGVYTRGLWPARRGQFPDWLQGAAEGLDDYLVSAPEG